MQPLKLVVGDLEVESKTHQAGRLAPTAMVKV